jgi:hypothetical protein
MKHTQQAIKEAINMLHFRTSVLAVAVFVLIPLSGAQDRTRDPNIPSRIGTPDLVPSSRSAPQNPTNQFCAFSRTKLAVTVTNRGLGVAPESLTTVMFSGVAQPTTIQTKPLQTGSSVTLFVAVPACGNNALGCWATITTDSNNRVNHDNKDGHNKMACLVAIG